MACCSTDEAGEEEVEGQGSCWLARWLVGWRWYVDATATTSYCGGPKLYCMPQLLHCRGEVSRGMKRRRRKRPDNRGWNGHMLIHVHELGESRMMEAKKNGCGFKDNEWGGLMCMYIMDGYVSH